jgi:hypothetical protein
LLKRLSESLITVVNKQRERERDIGSWSLKELKEVTKGGCKEGFATSESECQ